ncbi:MAG: hypothetical protein ACK5PP_16055, partial [Acidimicrobiales bacterium]
MIRPWSVALLWCLLVGCSAAPEPTDPAASAPEPAVGDGPAEELAGEFGPGSLVTALLPYRADEVAGGEGAAILTPPLEFTGPPCPEPDPLAMTTAAWTTAGVIDVVQVAVALHPDEASAAAAVAEAAERDLACAEAQWELSAAAWAGLGVGTIEVGDPAGVRFDAPV